MNALDPDKVEFLVKNGVREIDLKGTLHRAAVDYAKRDAQPVGIFNALRKHFNALSGFSVHDVQPDGLRVGVTLKIDRREKGVPVGYKKLEKLALEIIQTQEDDDQYCIITKDGQKINPSEIVLHSSVNLPKMGKSVQRETAWDALAEYYDTLARNGLLEQ